MSKLAPRIEKLERASGLDADRAARTVVDAESFLATMGALAERCAESGRRSDPATFESAVRDVCRRTGDPFLMEAFNITPKAEAVQCA